MHFDINIKNYGSSYALLSEAEVDTAVVFVHGFGGDASETWLEFQSLVDAEEHETAYRSVDLYFYSFDSVNTLIPVAAAHITRFVRDVIQQASCDVFDTNLGSHLEWFVSEGEIASTSNENIDQMFIGCVIYAGTTVLSYWFPITGLIIIFALQALWVIVSVTEDEKLT